MNRPVCFVFCSWFSLRLNYTLLVMISYEFFWLIKIYCAAKRVQLMDFHRFATHLFNLQMNYFHLIFFSILICYEFFCFFVFVLISASFFLINFQIKKMGRKNQRPRQHRPLKNNQRPNHLHQVEAAVNNNRLLRSRISINQCNN